MRSAGTDPSSTLRPLLVLLCHLHKVTTQQSSYAHQLHRVEAHHITSGLAATFLVRDLPTYYRPFQVLALDPCSCFPQRNGFVGISPCSVVVDGMVIPIRVHKNYWRLLRQALVAL